MMCVIGTEILLLPLSQNPGCLWTGSISPGESSDGISLTELLTVLKKTHDNAM